MLFVVNKSMENVTEPHVVYTVMAIISPLSSSVIDLYLKQEVKATKVKERITFQEAKERVLSKFIRPGVSFATVLAKYKKDTIYFKNQPKKTPAEPSTKKKRRLSDDKQVVEPPAKLRANHA